MSIDYSKKKKRQYTKFIIVPGIGRSRSAIGQKIAALCTVSGGEGGNSSI